MSLLCQTTSNLLDFWFLFVTNRRIGSRSFVNRGSDGSDALFTREETKPVVPTDLICFRISSTGYRWNTTNDNWSPAFKTDYLDPFLFKTCWEILTLALRKSFTVFHFQIIDKSLSLHSFKPTRKASTEGVPGVSLSAKMELITDQSSIEVVRLDGVTWQSSLLLFILSEIRSF